MTEHNSLNISPDGKIIKINYIDEKTAKIQFKTEFENQYQRDYFFEHIKHVITNFKSSLARMGFDQFLQGDIDILQNSAYYTAMIEHVYPDYFPQGGDIKNMMHVGDKIGKLYLVNEEQQLNAT